MAVTTPAATLAMTEQQRRDFEQQGFILLENFFSPSEFDRLHAAIDEVAHRIQQAKGLQKQAEGKLQKGVGDLKEAVTDAGKKA